MSDGKNEADLIFDILAGDVNAYAGLVKRYQMPIYNLMMRFDFSEADAFDLTQETFIRAYEKLEQFKPTARFFPWLYAIGLNIARDHLRQKKRGMILEEVVSHFSDNPSFHSSPERVDVDALDAKHVEEALNRLPLEVREAIFLRFHEGMAMNEIAKALGLTSSAVKMRIHRGLLKLRQFLSGASAHEK